MSSRNLNTFEEIIAVVLNHEGGYVNHPNDRGGETNFGISKRAFPREDIKALTRERAIELYRKHYWDPTRCADVPAPIRAIHFDSAVNHGPVMAIRLLQRAAGVRDDGIYGHRTAAAAANVTIDRYVAERIALFERIVVNNPSQKVFLKGWIKRAKSFLK